MGKDPGCVDQGELVTPESVPPHNLRFSYRCGFTPLLYIEFHYLYESRSEICESWPVAKIEFSGL